MTRATNRPTTHGARSEATVNRVAGYRKRSLLGRLGLAQRDLPPVDRYLLDQWAQVEAEVLLMARYISEHGLIDENGKLAGFSNSYYAARNAGARLLTKLEPRLLKVASEKETATSSLDRILREHDNDNPGGSHA